MIADVLYNRKILPAYYRLGIGLKKVSSFKPGEFIMLRITEQVDPLLRRPFGVYRILGSRIRGQGSRVREQGIEILYKVVGKGTRLMTGLKPGDKLDILGSLGNGFPLTDKGQGAGVKGKEIIMIAGGIGIAPFYLLAERLKAEGFRQRLLFGGRSKDDLPGLDDFKKLKINIKISTQDGSVGKKGLVTDLLKSELRTPNSKLQTIYACGPKGMLKEVERVAKTANAPCYVSLDNVMACGIGACLGCAVKSRAQSSELRVQRLKGLKSPLSALHSESSYKMVCKDGPVFDAWEIEWEEV